MPHSVDDTRETLPYKTNSAKQLDWSAYGTEETASNLVPKEEIGIGPPERTQQPTGAVVCVEHMDMVFKQ